MVRYEHVRRFGALAQAMHEALRAEEGAFTLQAFTRRSGDGVAGKHTVIELQAIHVVIFSLLNIRKQGGD